MDLPCPLNNAKIITQEIRQLLCNTTIFSFLGAKLHSLRVALQLGCNFLGLRGTIHLCVFNSILKLQARCIVQFLWLCSPKACTLSIMYVQSKYVMPCHIAHYIIKYLNLSSDKGAFARMYA
jgi:hypothetical protein